MECVKTVIAEDNTALAQLLRDFFESDQNFHVVDVCENGETCLEILRHENIDLLLLDMIMPIVDGYGILEAIPRERLHKPKIIVFSGMHNEERLKQALDLGVDYFVFKPFKMDLLMHRIKTILDPEAFHKGHFDERMQLEVPKQVIEHEIADYLSSLTIHANVKGYHYLKEAIIMVAYDMNLMDEMTRNIYNVIADKYESNDKRVERAMRHAIESAWNRCNIETIEQIFGYTVSDNRGKPTNSEFIAMIADQLRIKHHM